MLYFTSLEIFKRMSYEQLGEFVAKEMKWLAGETPEPEFENDLQFCCHIRNKEIMQAKEYDRLRKKKGKDKPAQVEEEPQEEESAPFSGYDPTYDECLQNLQMIRNESGDGPMEAEANRYERMYGYSTRDLCVAVRGY